MRRLIEVLGDLRDAEGLRIHRRRNEVAASVECSKGGKEIFLLARFLHATSLPRKSTDVSSIDADERIRIS